MSCSLPSPSSAPGSLSAGMAVWKERWWLFGGQVMRREELAGMNPNPLPLTVSMHYACPLCGNCRGLAGFYRCRQTSPSCSYPTLAHNCPQAGSTSRSLPHPCAEQYHVMKCRKTGKARNFQERLEFTNLFTAHSIMGPGRKPAQGVMTLQRQALALSAQPCVPDGL